MALRNVSLDPTFLADNSITEEFKPTISCGQKEVHFVIRNGEKIVLKIFHYGKDERFDREMKIYEQFKELSGIPKVLEIGEFHGQVFVFEEYIEGDTLSDILINYKNNHESIKLLMLDIFEILSPIWNSEYVHRDIKPENIIIRPNGKPVILDFGIARDIGDSTITPVGFQPHSWAWASPEQYEGRKDLISYRSDFFSLGVLAYFLFHQSRPFGNTKDEITAKFKSADESFLNTDDFPLKGFCTNLMHFSPSERSRKIEDAINLL